MIFDDIKKYAKTFSPSEMEGRMGRVLKRRLEPLADGIRMDELGNLYVFREGELPGVLGLSAHQDKVLNYAGDGILVPKENGKFTPVLDGVNEDVGTFTYARMVLENEDEFTPVEIQDVSGKDYLEIRYRPGKGGSGTWELPGIEVAGDEGLTEDLRFCILPRYREGKKRIYGKLDDAVGLALITDIFENVPRSESPNLMAVLTVQEETGHHGAKYVIKNNLETIDQMDEMVVVDTTPKIYTGESFALYFDCAKKRKWDGKEKIWSGEYEPLEKKVLAAITEGEFDGIPVHCASNDSVVFSKFLPTVALEPSIRRMHSFNESIKKTDLSELQEFLHYYVRNFEPL